MFQLREETDRQQIMRSTRDMCLYPPDYKLISITSTNTVEKEEKVDKYTHCTSSHAYMIIFFTSFALSSSQCMLLRRILLEQMQYSYFLIITNFIWSYLKIIIIIIISYLVMVGSHYIQLCFFIKKMKNQL